MLRRRALASAAALAPLAFALLCGQASARAGQAPPEVSAAVHADAAAAAAERARNAAASAQRVAEHSVTIAERAHDALDHAHDVVRAARVGARGLSPEQEESLRKAEAKLRSARQLAEYGAAGIPATVAANASSGAGAEVAGMQNDLEQLRRQLASSGGGSVSGDKSVEQMDEELRDLQDMLKKLEDDERRQGRAGPATASAHKELKVEIQHLREALNRLDRFGKVTASIPERTVRDPETGELRYRVPRRREEPRVQLTPLVDLEVSGAKAAAGGGQAQRRQPPAPAAPAPEQPRTPAAAAPSSPARVDVDTDMPYGDIEPFGREDTAQELTEASISESNAMVDQLERAEVAEEKRAVFRALTRLRGAAIASFDGVARAQTGNIDEYNKVNQWRKSHPLNHLANEESDVSRWAFPANAD